jgi:uncharacterized protein (DUF433 family)
MQLEDYFEFLGPQEIKLKGHRVWLEHVLYEYIYRERTAEQIAREFDTVSLDKIYASILYYLQNKEIVSQYIADWLESGRRAREEQARKHPELVETLGRLMEQRKADKKVAS